jgi:hypothetical protein
LWNTVSYLPGEILIPESKTPPVHQSNPSKISIAKSDQASVFLIEPSIISAVSLAAAALGWARFLDTFGIMEG